MFCSELSGKSLHSQKRLRAAHQSSTDSSSMARMADDESEKDLATQQEGNLSKKIKERLRMFLVSLTVGGIDICYAAEVTFVSPLYLQLGVPINLMTMCWMISPVLGFFLVPILGGASDSCRSRLGKRRPFIILYSAGKIGRASCRERV